MLIKYLYNSGFLLETERCNILIDCVSDIVLPESSTAGGKPLYVLASHAHGDHYDERIWAFDSFDPSPLAKNIIYILSGDIANLIPDKRNKNIFYLDKGDVYKDEQLKISGFGSTDIGISFLIEILEADKENGQNRQNGQNGSKIFHAGDLNNWHWNQESAAAEIAEAEAFFRRELEDIASQVKQVDIMFFPVDSRLGTDYMAGPEEFLRRIPAKKFIPMHFREQIDSANAFEPIAHKLGAEFIKAMKPGSVIFEE